MSTIASISTAPGIGGIGIIRMSGEKSFEVLGKDFPGKNTSRNRKYKRIYHEIWSYQLKIMKWCRWGVSIIF